MTDISAFGNCHWDSQCESQWWLSNAKISTNSAFNLQIDIHFRLKTLFIRGGRNCELSMSCSRINAKIGRFTYESRIRPLTNLSILQQAWTIITMSLFLLRKFISKTFKLSWKMSIDQIKIPRTFSLWKDRLIFWGWGMTFISQNVFQPEMCLKVHDCYSIT